MQAINDYSDPFDALEEFENAISEFTGAPGVILTDSCTHAIELGLRYKMPELYATLPHKTYISVPMTLHKLGIDFMYTAEEWKGEYRIEGSNVWDSARLFEKDMYSRGKMQCLSFGHTKTLEIGHGGAILTDDKKAYKWLKRAAYDGRDLSIKHWWDQTDFNVGYHYMMRPEDAVIGLNKLAANDFNTNQSYKYPDLREIKINT